MEKRKQGNWSSLMWVLIFAVLIGVVIYLAIAGQNDNYIEYSAFQQEVQEGNINNVDIEGYTIKYLKKDTKIEAKNFPRKFDGYTTTVSGTDAQEWLTSYNASIDEKIANGELTAEEGAALKVRISSRPLTQSWFEVLLPYLLIIGGSVLMFWLVIRALNKNNSSAMTFGRSRAKLGNNSKVTFADVAGAEEEKAELQEVVEFLKNPQKFVKLGARIPKGFLMVGPPGTGKTLLAKAVAGESNVPFFSITGSDFVEMFVGVGASRVRDLFEQAKHATPCIVFIDEIDAVGRQRGAGLGGGNDEREQTLNQLLTQMDGFEANSGIVVMAATNRADVLDPALTRPGRFDRQIYVYPPDVKGREAILKVHARNKKIASDVNFKDIARLTTGFTGADIELVLNEAAIFAARENRQNINNENILNAINKVTLGPQKKSRVITETDKKITAYHEAGHAVIGKLLVKDNAISEVSIIPRGGAAGYTLSRPETDNSHVLKSYLESELVMMMGGRAAELIVFGDVSTGAVGDIKQATNVATQMVTEWGMSSLGPINYKSGEEMFLGKDYLTKSSVSEEMSSKIDAEVSQMLNDALEKATTLLKKNRKIMDEMVSLLFERETIYTEEIDKLLKGVTAEEILKDIKKKEEDAKKASAEQAQKEIDEAQKQKEFQKQQEDEENRRKAQQALDFLNENGIVNARIVEEDKPITKIEDLEKINKVNEKAKTSTKKQDKENKEDK